MNENRKLIVKLIPYINASNPIRRKGIINMIRNIMLDDYYWDKLVDNIDKDGYLKEIINRVCANLNGSHLIQNKVVDPKSLLLLSNREYTLHVTLRLKKPVPQRVNAPRFKKPKNYSYFVVVENQRGEVLVGVCWWRDV